MYRTSVCDVTREIQKKKKTLRQERKRTFYQKICFYINITNSFAKQYKS